MTQQTPAGDPAPTSLAAPLRTFYVAMQPAGGQPSHIVGGLMRVPQGHPEKMPAVVIVHGSNGVDGRGMYHAQSLNEMGIVTLELDLWAARGNFGGAAGRPSGVPETLDDAFGALHYLAGLPFVDPARIGITGYSWGGVVSMLTATTPYAEKFDQDGLRFAAHLPFYPVCWTYNELPGYEFADLTGAPVHILAGAEDDYDDPDGCPRLVQGLPEKQRGNVSVTVYPGATHGWNGADGTHASVHDPAAHKGKGGPVRFHANPEVRELSRKATDEFFRTTLAVEAEPDSDPAP